MSVWGSLANFANVHVSDDGKVNYKGQCLKQHDNGHGYKYVSIKGKKYYVHRLVASVFVPNEERRLEVNHKDGVKSNNSASNLEWVTRKLNQRHMALVLKKGYSGKRLLCVETGDVFKSSMDCERKTGISSAAIRMVLCGKHSKCAGFHWEYTDMPITKIDCSKYRKDRINKARLAKKIGISSALLRWRLNNGWSYDEIKSLKPNLGNRYIRASNLQGTI